MAAGAAPKRLPGIQQMCRDGKTGERDISDPLHYGVSDGVSSKAGVSHGVSGVVPSVLGALRAQRFRVSKFVPKVCALSVKTQEGVRALSGQGRLGRSASKPAWSQIRSGSKSDRV